MTQSIVHDSISGIALVAERRSKAVFARCLTMLVVLTVANSTIAQDRLVDARDLYRAAAYDDALARLEALRGSAHGADDDRIIHAYRAFCLIALSFTRLHGIPAVVFLAAVAILTLRLLRNLGALELGARKRESDG